jgi:hypothetical protein
MTTTRTKKPDDLKIRSIAAPLLRLPARPDEDGFEDFLKLIKRKVHSTWQLREVVQQLLDNCQFFPTNREFLDALEATPAEKPPEFQPVNPHCELCSGIGFTIQMRGGYSAAQVCACRKTPRIAKVS